MLQKTRRQALGAALALPLVAIAAPAFAEGGSVGVTVNGAAVVLSPAPVTRAGRVFVPLRGIFERLGASVVYAGGVINATGQGNRTISLKIGSTTATVNGVSQPIDVAPFVIGASTYVPLRFVGQALGAQVNFDGANQIVAITTSGGGAPPQQGAQPPVAAATAAASLVGLSGEEPAPATFVAATRPTISTNFTHHVDPNSMHVTLDGRDITSEATLSESGLVYAPPSPLQSVRHVVVVTGKDSTGAAFTKQWAFTSGTATAANFVKLRGLVDGGAVSGSDFSIAGDTLPNARVHVIAGASRSFGNNAFSFPTGNYSGDTTADAAGHFTLQVSLQTVPGGVVAVDVTSTDPTTKASAEEKLRLTSQ